MKNNIRLYTFIIATGNNFVGTRNYISIPRQFTAFEKVFSGINTLAVVHRKNEPNSVIQTQELKDLLSKKGVKVIDLAVEDLNDLSANLESHLQNIDVVSSACDTLIHRGGEEIITE